MTEQKRKEAIYDKVRKQYPGKTDPQEINRLAIKAARNRATWISVAFLWTSILCAGLFCFDFITGALAGGCIVLFVVATFEYFRTVLNSVKIKAHYPSGIQTPFEGTLTYTRIHADCKTMAGQGFKIVKATLCDKDDRDDSGVSFIFHKYNLFFNLEDSVSAVGLRVKRRVYLKAPLDAKYILVLSSDENVMAAYIADAWEISSELYDQCTFSADVHNSMLQRQPAASDSTMPKDNNIVLNIVLIVAHVLAWFIPIILVVLYLPFTTFFATQSAVKKRNVLSLLAVALGYIIMIYAALYFCLL